MFTRILVPLDGSEYAEQALRYVAALAKPGSASVRLLSVTQRCVSAHCTADGDQGDDDELWETYLASTAATLRAAGVLDVDTDVRPGEPASGITNVARENRCDLIMMSTQGRGANGQYALGSVALQVLMTAPCPIFIVRINPPKPPRDSAEERWQEEGGRNVG